MSRIDDIRPQTQIGTIPVHDARTLTEGTDRAQITLDDKIYDLRITRAGKLILTK